MQSLKCSEVLAELPLFVGGDLEAPGRDRVATHLGSCEPCRDALARASEARAVLSEHLERTAATPSLSVWPDLRTRLRAEGLIHAEPLAAAPLAGGGRLLRFLPRAAAAAGLLLAGVLAGQWFGAGADGSLPPAVDGSRVVIDAPAAPRSGETGLRPVTGPASGAVAEATPAADGLREVDPQQSLGDRASLFVDQPILPLTPFQSNRMRMASYGQQGSAQQPPVIDPTQLLLQRGIR